MKPNLIFRFYLLSQNPAEVMGDNKSCKSAKDEHSTKYVFDFFSCMNFETIVFFVFLFLIFFIAGTVPLTVKEE